VNRVSECSWKRQVPPPQVCLNPSVLPTPSTRVRTDLVAAHNPGMYRGGSWSYIRDLDLRYRIPGSTTIFHTSIAANTSVMSTTDQLSPEQVAKLAGEDLGPLSRNIIIAFTVMAFVSVCLRLYTRLRYKAVGWEDYTIGIAMV
jgi:hypothetical protein